MGGISGANMTATCILCIILILLVLTTATADFTFVQISDTHVGVKDTAYNARYAEVIRQVNALKPDFVIHTGDALQIWSPENMALFKDLSKSLAPPMHLAPGNHDITEIGKISAGEAEARIKVWREAAGYDHDSFEHQGCVFIGLDSNLYNSKLPEEARQMTWLKSQLKKAQGKRIFIFQHQPLFLDKPDEPANYWVPAEPARGELLKLFHEYKVEAVLTGHLHKFNEAYFGGISFISTPATSFSCAPDRGLTGYRVFQVTGGGFSTRFVDMRTAGTPAEFNTSKQQ